MMGSDGNGSGSAKASHLSKADDDGSGIETVPKSPSPIGDHFLGKKQPPGQNAATSSSYYGRKASYEDKVRQRETFAGRLERGESEVSNESKPSSGGGRNNYDELLARKLAGAKTSRGEAPMPAFAQADAGLSATSSQGGSFEERLKRKLAEGAGTSMPAEASVQGTTPSSTSFDERLQIKLAGGTKVNKDGTRAQSPTISSAVAGSKDQASTSSFDERLKKKLAGDAEAKVGEQTKSSSSTEWQGSDKTSGSSKAASSFDERMKRKLAGEIKAGNDARAAVEITSYSPNGQHTSDMSSESSKAATSFDERLRSKLARETKASSDAGGSNDRVGVPLVSSGGPLSFDERSGGKLASGGEAANSNTAPASQISSKLNTFNEWKDRTVAGEDNTSCDAQAENPVSLSSSGPLSFEDTSGTNPDDRIHQNHSEQTNIDGATDCNSNSQEVDEESCTSNIIEPSLHLNVAEVQPDVSIQEDSNLNDIDGNEEFLPVGNIPFANSRVASTNKPNIEWKSDESMPIIPEAFLVERNSIIDVQAEPLLPWWKQRRTRVLLLSICILIMILTISFGVIFGTYNKFSGDEAAKVMTYMVNATDSPSSSFVPSSQPTACVYKISSNSKKLDLLLDESSKLKLAVDRSNLVVVMQGKAPDVKALATYIMFYSLKGGEWGVVNVFTEEFSLGETANVALSGNLALVGLPQASNGAGNVAVYDRNIFGFWTKLEDPFIFLNDDSFSGRSSLGQSVGLDGDLACASQNNVTHIFHRQGVKWEELGMSLDEISSDPPYNCFISGNTIALSSETDGLFTFRYDEELKEVLFMNDLLAAISETVPKDKDDDSTGSINLSQDYLVHSSDATINIYHQNTNETFTYSEQIFSPDYISNRVALDRDILVIGGSNHTYIFSEMSGHWHETILLEQSFDGYHISGRNILAVKGTNVQSFFFDDCIQDMPTQQPSLSLAPSGQLECIVITFVYDDYPSESSWELKSMNDGVLEAFSASEGDKHLTDSICLPDGDYEFTVYDSVGDGICCDYGTGNYNMTTSNGYLLLEGASFGELETTPFTIPFAQAPSAVPSISQSPSSSQPPSSGPSISIPYRHCSAFAFFA